MKDKLPIITIVGCAIIVLALAVFMRMGMGGAPQAAKPPAPEPEAAGGESGYSARVEERLAMLRKEYERRQKQEALGGAGASGDTDSRPTQGQHKAGVGGTAPGKVAVDADGPVGTGPHGAPSSPAELTAQEARDKKRVARLHDKILNGATAEERRDAVSDLATEDDPEAVSILLLALKDRDSDVRMEVLLSLSILDDQVTPDMLQPALSDSDPEVRFEALSLMGAMGGTDALAAALDAMRDSDQDVRDLARGMIEIEQGGQKG